MKIQDYYGVSIYKFIEGGIWGMAKVTRIKRDEFISLCRVLVVIDNEGNMLEGIEIRKEPGDSDDDIELLVASEITRLKKEYPRMRIDHGIAYGLSGFFKVFPEILSPKGS